ncbi:MAG: ABC transporter permease [Actinomycetota bacterium]|nr:ABC transporter permease [Actinomycetota bacterium]
MKVNNKTIFSYEPDNSLKRGYIRMLGEITGEIKKNHWLTYQLAKRDFLKLYKQSFIGVFWALLIPLISVGTFVLLNNSGVFNMGDIDVPYAIFAVIGIALWQLFSAGLVATSKSLVDAGSMITKVNFSKKSLVIAAYAQCLVPFFTQVVFAAILFACYRIIPDLAVLLVPLAIMPMILFTMGLGFILALLNGIARDIGNVIAVLITFLMFLTPVLYAKPDGGLLASISRYNPLYYLISAPRDLVIKGSIDAWRGFLVAAIISVVIFFAGIVTFHMTETRIAERV